MTLLRNLAVSLSVCCGVLSCVPQPQPSVQVRPESRKIATTAPISLQAFYPLLESGRVLVYDARPYFYYCLGHLPGAISLPKGGGDAQILNHELEIKTALAAGKTIVIYCSDLACPDAQVLADHMAALGFPCSILTGGWETWKDSSLPTESIS